MKKILITLCVVLITLSASAQKGETAVGANILYGSKLKNIGIGAKGQYNFTDNIRGEASFDYFLKKEGVSMWGINANIHYLFDVTDKIKVYPLAGIGYVNTGGSGDDDDWGYDDDDDDDYGWGRAASYEDDDDDYGYDGSSSSDGKIAINLGCGVQFALTEKISINAELKYQIIDNFNQIVPSIGITYKF